MLLHMQEQLYDELLLHMVKKTYRPASHYAPCSHPHQSPADVNSLASEPCHKETAPGKIPCLLLYILH